VRRRALGSAGPELSAVGFGSWAIGGPWKFGWGPVDEGESVAAIRHAVEHGVNWIDTAAVYGLGHSEEVVGRAVEPFRAGEDVFVFTKCGRRWPGDPDLIENDLRPTSIREECDDSLRRLGVERIDLFQFHWPDWTTGTPLEESWSTMAELVEEGKVRWAGVCNFDVEQLERCEAVRHVDSVQPPLSLLARGARSTVLPWAAAHGTGVIVYSPMGSGMLTGAFDAERIARLDPDDWRRHSPLFLRAASQPQPRAGRAAASARREASDDAAGAHGRLDAGAAGRHRSDRGRPPPAPRRWLAVRRGSRVDGRRAERDRRDGRPHRGRLGRAARPAAAHAARDAIVFVGSRV
jgi:aryl-alcohol dehydrogenase-like predicted oxidoreductase